MEVVFVRHSKTEGNAHNRYIGTTDEDLSPIGVLLAEDVLNKNIYPPCELSVVSPMKRCIQTNQILYGDTENIICHELKECDFGDFENKNYIDLQDNKDYQAWIDSNATLPFPNGESHEDFTNRCTIGFEQMYQSLSKRGIKSVAFVVHGGTIMSIMERFCSDNSSFYDYQIKNCEGYITEVSLDKNQKIKIDILKKVTM